MENILVMYEQIVKSALCVKKIGKRKKKVYETWTRERNNNDKERRRAYQLL